MTYYLIELSENDTKKYYFNQRTLVNNPGLAHPFPSQELALQSFGKSSFKALPYRLVKVERDY